MFIKKFWSFFIWNALCSDRSTFYTDNKDYLVDLSSTNSHEVITSIINDAKACVLIEADLENINKELRKNDQRLIITFDQLDNIVKPPLWNDVIAPLVKLVMRFTYSNIHPKLFLRRDLYERLGNLTNKNSFSTRLINLEWTQNEIFSYFLKMVFSYAEKPFFDFLSQVPLSGGVELRNIRSKLKTKGIVHNQLLDRYLIEPIVNAFFGAPRSKKNSKKIRACPHLSFF